MGGPQRFRAGDKISSGPHMGRLATSRLPSGVPNALERGTKSALAHKWPGWLGHPCRMGGPQRFKAGESFLCAFWRKLRICLQKKKDRHVFFESNLAFFFCRNLRNKKSVGHATKKAEIL